MKLRERSRRPYVFVDATERFVLDLLHDPDYAGEFRFPKWVPDTSRPPKWKDGPFPLRRALPEELRVQLADRHEPYVTREQWKLNVATLRSNAPTRSQRSFGDGPALLQRLLECGACGRRMSPAYKPKKRDGSECHGYHCQSCNYRIPGNVLDATVIPHVLGEHLSRERLERARAGWRRAVTELPAARTTRVAELELAEKAAGEARKAYSAVDPFNRFAAAELEKEWSEKLGKVAALRVAVDRVPGELELLGEDGFDELVSLCSEANELFQASTTSILNRKLVLDALLERIVFEDRTHEVLRVRLVWKDGSPDERLIVNLYRAAYPVIRDLLAGGFGYPTIAQVLNAQGYRNMRQGPWTGPAVGAAARAMKLDRRAIGKTRNERVPSENFHVTAP